MSVRRCIEKEQVKPTEKSQCSYNVVRSVDKILMITLPEDLKDHHLFSGGAEVNPSHNFSHFININFI